MQQVASISMMQLNLKLWIFLFSLWTLSTASITAVSSIKECINDGSGEILRPNGTACRKKLVVTMTVQANEVMDTYVVMAFFIIE